MASTGSFPAGLKVLVVDDDLKYLNNLEKNLIKHKYQVTSCNQAKDALQLIEGRKVGFDIVICEANLRDMDGLKFLEQVGRLRLNLPVILMSADGETSKVMRGVEHGACDYLIKPIRSKVLQNIWQHVVRRRVHEGTSVEANGATDSSDNGCTSSREMVSTKNGESNESASPLSVKKPRVVWSDHLHDKFVKIVDQIGLEKAAPKKILDMMEEQNLSRENIASHLQKYRISVNRKKEDERKASYVGTNSQNVCLQSEVNQNALIVHRNRVINENYHAQGHHQLQIQNLSNNEGFNESRIMSLPMQGDRDIAVLGSSVHHPIRCNQPQFEPQDSAVRPESMILWSGGAPPAVMADFQSGYWSDHLPLASHNPRMEVDTYSHFYGYRSIGTDNTPPFIPIPQHSLFEHSQTFEPVEQNLQNNPESSSNMIVGTGTGSSAAQGLHDAELNGYYSAAYDFCPQNPHPGNIDPLSYINQDDLITDAQPEVKDMQVASINDPFT